MTPAILTGESYPAIADAADRLEKNLKTPLYRVAASWLNSDNPGETAGRIDQQITIAQAAGASLMIDGADDYFTGQASEGDGAGAPLVAVHSLVRKFASAGIPLIFAIEDEQLARRTADKTGWTLTIAG